MSTAYQRMKKIKTFYFICTGIGVLGFALVAVPVQLGLLLDDSYGYGAYTRGWMLSLTSIASLVAIPIAGLAYDRLVPQEPRARRAPRRVVHHRRTACCCSSRCASSRSCRCWSSSRSAGACTSRRVRERRADRRRGRAVPHAHPGVRAHPGVHLPHGRLLRRHPRRRALRRARRAHRAVDRRADRRDDRRPPVHVRVALPEARHLARGRGAARGAGRARAHERAPRRHPGAAGPQPRLQLRTGAGAVRRRPRGARGARCSRCSARTAPGKSTLLRAISGLGIPDRGVVRLNGRTLTYVDAEIRFRAGHRAAARRRGRRSPS